CLVEYRPGKRYLIFADSLDPANRIIGTGICSGSGEIKLRDRDYLAEIRSYAKANDILISGQVVDYYEKALARVSLSLQSNGEEYVASTDEKGNFTFSPPRDGPFALRIELPFKAFDDGFNQSKAIIADANRSVFEYTGSVRTGECIYKRFVM